MIADRWLDVPGDQALLVRLIGLQALRRGQLFPPPAVQRTPWNGWLLVGQSYPKVLFDVDRDELSQPLRSARMCKLSFDERVVLFCRRVHDAP